MRKAPLVGLALGETRAFLRKEKHMNKQVLIPLEIWEYFKKIGAVNERTVGKQITHTLRQAMTAEDAARKFEGQ